MGATSPALPSKCLTFINVSASSLSPSSGNCFLPLSRLLVLFSFFLKGETRLVFPSSSSSSFFFDGAINMLNDATCFLCCAVEPRLCHCKRCLYYILERRDRIAMERKVHQKLNVELHQHRWRRESDCIGCCCWPSGAVAAAESIIISRERKKEKQQLNSKT